MTILNDIQQSFQSLLYSQSDKSQPHSLPNITKSVMAHIWTGLSLLTSSTRGLPLGMTSTTCSTTYESTKTLKYHMVLYGEPRKANGPRLQQSTSTYCIHNNLNWTKKIWNRPSWHKNREKGEKHFQIVCCQNQNTPAFIHGLALSTGGTPSVLYCTPPKKLITLKNREHRTSHHIL